MGKNVLFLGVTSLLTDVSSEMVATVLPVYLVYSLALSPLHVGAIDGMYHGVAAIVRVVTGVVSDRLRRPKEVAGIGYTVSALSKLGLLVGASSVPILAGALVVDRMGKGVRSAPRDALVAASASTDAMGAAFGVHRAFDAAGAMLGPLLAFALLAFIPGAFDAVFMVSFCVAVVGVAFFWLLVEGRQRGTPAPTEPTEAPANVRPEPSGVSALRSRRFLVLVAMAALLGATTLSDGLFYLVLQRRTAVSPGYLPLAFVGSALVYAMLALPIGRLADRRGRAPVFIGGYALLAAAYVLAIAPVPSAVAIVGGIALVGAFYAATNGVLMALAAPLLPPSVRASGLSILATSQTVARFGGSIAFGAVWAAWDESRAIGVFLVGAILAMGASALLWGSAREESPTDAR